MKKDGSHKHKFYLYVLVEMLLATFIMFTFIWAALGIYDTMMDSIY